MLPGSPESSLIERYSVSPRATQGMVEGGQAWSRATPPMGRPKAVRAMTAKERQKIFRARKSGLAHQMPI